MLPLALELEDSGRFFGPNDLASAVLETRPEMEIYVRSAAGQPVPLSAFAHYEQGTSEVSIAHAGQLSGSFGTAGHSDDRPRISRPVRQVFLESTATSCATAALAAPDRVAEQSVRLAKTVSDLAAWAGASRA